MRYESIWFGRFQPVSIAHLVSLQEILKEWRIVNIGIVKPTLPSPGISVNIAQQFTDSSSFASKRNPFSLEEVRQLWIACLDAHSLRERVRLHVVPRPEYWQEYKNKKVFPPEVIDHVQIQGGSGDPDTESFRRGVYPTYYGRTIWRIQVPFTLHNSIIRRRVTTKQGTWRDFIPKGAYELFIQINGPARCLSL